MYVFKAGVVGAGVMGGEIAQVIAFAGIPVVLKDVDQRFLDKGLAQVRSILKRRVDKGKMTAEELDEQLGRVTPTLSFDEFADVDLVIEAVPEVLAVKEAVYRDLDTATPPHAILASNTSGLSITQLGSFTSRPDKVVGAHFFAPASVMKLVEVIPGERTSSETVDSTAAFVESIRKVAVRVRETPAFAVNRVLSASLAQILRYREETGASPEEIDQAVVEAKAAPMGPFRLMDMSGLDTVLHTQDNLVERLGARYGGGAHELRRMVEAGELGVKSGKGYFEYGGKG
jgi:3-hydroxyacyl-CoA dehydrogenase